LKQEQDRKRKEEDQKIEAERKQKEEEAQKIEAERKQKEEDAQKELKLKQEEDQKAEESKPVHQPKKGKKNKKESSDETASSEQQNGAKSKGKKKQKEEVVVQKHTSQNEASLPKEPEPITEQLIVDVIPDEGNNHRMKSSVDSGVDIGAESLRSSQKSSSNESISGTETPKKSSTSSEASKQIAAKQTEILQQITEFVTYAQQKLSSTQVVHSEAPRKVFTFTMPTPLPKKAEPKKRERAHRLLEEDIKYCTYMIEKYGDDYEAMSKDSANRFLDDSRTLQRKIRIFKGSCHYDEYLATKAS